MLIELLEAKLKPGSPVTISTALAAVAETTRIAKASEAESRAKAALYVEYLKEYPDWAVRKACDQWIKTQKFWPAVAEIRALCDEAVRLDRIRLARLKKIRDTPPVPEITRTPEQVAKVSEITRQTIAALRAQPRKDA